MDSVELPNLEMTYMAHRLLVLLIVFLVITTTVVGLRVWSRWLMKAEPHHPRQFGWDDWLAIAALPFIFTLFGTTVYQIKLGLGHHAWELPPEVLITHARITWASYFIFEGCLFLQKLSILLFIGRIFPKYVNSRLFNTALWLVHAANLSWLVGIYLGIIFACNPPAKNWYPEIPGTCTPASSLWLGCTVPSVAVDLMILLLPLPKVWNLRASRERKVALGIVFILGYSVVIVSIGRLIKVMKSLEELNDDFTYEIVSVQCWMTAEISISLMAICFPALLVLGNHISKSYLIPFSTRLSSVFKSGSQLLSKTSNGFSELEAQGGSGRATMRTPPGEKSPPITKLEPYASREVHETIHLSPEDNNHTVGVFSNPRDIEENVLPAHGVWLESDVRISRQ